MALLLVLTPMVILLNYDKKTITNYILPVRDGSDQITLTATVETPRALLQHIKV